MTTQKAPSGATVSLAQKYAVVDHATLLRIQRLADAALEFVASQEDAALDRAAQDGRVTAYGAVSAIARAAAARAGLEELMGLVDDELLLPAMPGRERKSMTVTCMGKLVTLSSDASIPLQIAARAVEINALNLGWQRMFGETA